MITRRQFRRLPLWQQTPIYFDETDCSYAWQVRWFNDWKLALWNFSLTLPW